MLGPLGRRLWLTKRASVGKSKLCLTNLPLVSWSTELPFGSRSSPTTPLLAVPVCQAVVPLVSESIKLPSERRVSSVPSQTGLPRLASQTRGGRG
ncbi:hypothetical protein TIFTF001_045325 [Ficus carica]|uniref:Uncharacterized protein n=1 Tax=Ficus carica TaxID=3494 RepID=A0AA87Z7D2_FICCA|nr:hypothetical protein TIFTF001_045325 [Ficus carica]